MQGRSNTRRKDMIKIRTILWLLVFILLSFGCKNHTQNKSEHSIHKFYLNNRNDINPGLMNLMPYKDKIIFIDNHNLQLYILTESNKTILWKRETKKMLLNLTECMASYSQLNFDYLVVGNSILLINKENISCLSTDTGEILWSQNFSMGELSVGSFANASIHNGFIYFYIATDRFRSYLFKIDIDSGNIIEKKIYKNLHFFGKQYHFHNDIYQMSKKKKGKIQLLNINGETLDLNDRMKLKGKNIYSVNMLLDNSNLYIVDGNEIKCLDLNSNLEKWKTDIQLDPGFQLETHNDKLYIVGNYSYFIVAIDRKTGGINWRNNNYDKMLWSDKKFRRSNYEYYIPRPFHRVSFRKNYLSVIGEHEILYISLIDGRIIKKYPYSEDEYCFSTDTQLFKYFRNRIYEIEFDNGENGEELLLDLNEK